MSDLHHHHGPRTCFHIITEDEAGVIRRILSGEMSGEEAAAAKARLEAKHHPISFEHIADQVQSLDRKVEEERQ